MITSIKAHIKEIVINHRAYTEELKNKGGYRFFLRALAAQILWLILIYNVGVRLVPIKESLLANVTFLLLLGIFSFLWKVIKDKLPSWIEEFVKGNFFYKCGLAYLNYWIGFLIFANIALSFNYIKSSFKRVNN